MCARLAGTPVPYTSTSLSKPGGLAEVLGISGYTAHSASGDIYATREVLLRMIGKV
jgi:DNA polymerase III epsilon subunit-like protein